MSHPHSPEGAHHIHVCTACRDRETDTLPGMELMALLMTAKSDGTLLAAFNVSAVNCMAGCAHPCTVGFQGAGKAAWLFGDLTPVDVPDLVIFAHLYQALPDGWCISTERPGKLSRAALARIPARPTAESGAAA